MSTKVGTRARTRTSSCPGVCTRVRTTKHTHTPGEAHGGAGMQTWIPTSTCITPLSAFVRVCIRTRIVVTYHHSMYVRTPQCQRGERWSVRLRPIKTTATNGSVLRNGPMPRPVLQALVMRRHDSIRDSPADAGTGPLHRRASQRVPNPQTSADLRPLHRRASQRVPNPQTSADLRRGDVT
jgi:hypothetical protein